MMSGGKGYVESPGLGDPSPVSTSGDAAFEYYCNPNYDLCTGNEDEDEMVATERELAEDAQWKKIQQNTFTRWANEHLKTVEKHIGNLETDLSDGLRLITLIEVLSGRRLPKHNKRPSFRSQKLENVSVALKFLQEDEGIRIVNIGKSVSELFHIHIDISLAGNRRRQVFS